MSYTINSTNPVNSSITVQDQQLDNSTNLTFVGKNYSGYGPIIAEDFLHLLENFANVQPPGNVIGGQSLEGQLWYDTGNNQLNVYNGSQWNPVGSIKKSTVPPVDSIKGDIWVDENNYQLSIYNGNNWVLVGPQYSAGFQTGAQVLPIIDVSNATYNTTGVYSNGNLIAVISDTAFTPKTTILGFASIKQGITLNSVNYSNSSTPIKFWGRSSEADALNVNGTTINSSNFLRSDIISTTNQPLYIRNDGGISLGGDLSFNISSASSAIIFTSTSSGKGLNFSLKNSNGIIQSTMYLNANSKVGIGPNNTAPLSALDVAGIITIKDDTVSVPTIGGQLVVNGTNDIFSNGLLSISTTSITTAGGIAAQQGLYVGGKTILNGVVTLNNLDSNSNPIAASIVLPGANNSYDLGAKTAQFRNVYASTFGYIGGPSTFYGSFVGNVTGNVNGTANSLTTPTIFNMSGDILSSNLSVNGSGGTATFTTSLNPSVVYNLPEAVDTLSTDDFIVSRTITNPLTNASSTVLKKTSKQTFISNLPTVPIGAMFPFAGILPPAGY